MSAPGPTGVDPVRPAHLWFTDEFHKVAGVRIDCGKCRHRVVLSPVLLKKMFPEREFIHEAVKRSTAVSSKVSALGSKFSRVPAMATRFDLGCG